MDVIKPKILPAIAIFFSFLVILSIVYFPVLAGHYAHHDDYEFWEMQNGKIQSAQLLLGMGRYLAVPVTSGMSLFIKTIPDLSLIRFFTVFNFSILAMICFFGIRPYLKGDFNAFLFSLTLFTLPPFQAIAGWASASAISLGAVCSVLAAVFLFLMPPGKTLPDIIKSPFAILAFFLLVASLFIYQSILFFFFFC